MLLQSSYTVSYFSYCPYHFESSEKNLKKYTVYSFSVYICEFPYTAKIHSLRIGFTCFLFFIVPSLLFLHYFELHKCKFVAVTELMDETNQTIVETGTQLLAVWLCGPWIINVQFEKFLKVFKLYIYNSGPTQPNS